MNFHDAYLHSGLIMIVNAHCRCCDTRNPKIKIIEQGTAMLIHFKVYYGYV